MTIEAFNTEHGFTPTNKGASAIVRAEAERLGLDTKGAKSDGLRHTLEQIESLSDDDSAIKILARNALDRVSGRGAVVETSRNTVSNTGESLQA